MTLVGSTTLAGLAEAFMQGESVADAAIAREIAPCFVERDGRRTDAIVLACTHYPLLLDFFDRLAPWPVRWIDPAPAIARRADHVLSERFPTHSVRDADFTFVFTSGASPAPRLLKTVEVLREKMRAKACPGLGLRFSRTYCCLANLLGGHRPAQQGAQPRSRRRRVVERVHRKRRNRQN